MQKALKKYFPIFLLPTLIAFSIAFMIPFITGLYLSFCNFTTISDAKFVGIDNYIKAFSSGQGFVESFGFTTIFTIISIVTVNVFAFTLAYLLTRKIRATNFFRTVFFMPNLIGGIVLGYTWQSMINAFLANYGTTLVANQKFGFIGLIILMNWQMIGYMMIIYIAGLQSVPSELIESARIDGATKWQTLKNVTIPMVMPSITICTFLMHKTEMLALNIVNSFYGRNNYQGVGQAKAVIFFIVVAVIALSQLYFTRKREVEQ